MLFEINGPVLMAVFFLAIESLFLIYLTVLLGFSVLAANFPRHERPEFKEKENPSFHQLFFEFLS